MIQTALLAGWGTAVFAASAAVQQAKPRYKAPVRTSPGKTYIPNVDPEDLCPVCEGTCKVFCQACSGNGASVTASAVTIKGATVETSQSRNDMPVPIQIQFVFRLPVTHESARVCWRRSALPIPVSPTAVCNSLRVPRDMPAYPGAMYHRRLRLMNHAKVWEFCCAGKLLFDMVEGALKSDVVRCTPQGA